VVRKKSYALHAQWVDSERGLLNLDPRALKHKLEVMRLGQVVHNESHKNKSPKICE
jgi:hypothetical protein